MDRFLRKLDDRARLDVAPGLDVMADAGGGRTDGAAFAVVVGVDDDDWLIGPRLNDKSAGTKLLLRRERELRVGLRPHRAVNVEPSIHHPHVDEPVNPLFRQQVVDVSLAEARADPGKDLVLEAIADACHRLVEDALSAAALV